MNPFEELVGALNALNSQIDAPIQHSLSASTMDPPAVVNSAVTAMDALIGNIPLPADHPGWHAVAGPISEAKAAADDCRRAWQMLQEAASRVTEHLQVAQIMIDREITRLRGA